MAFYEAIPFTYQINSYEDTCFPNFFPKNEWPREESGFSQDSGRCRLSGEWWTWDRHLFLTSLKVPYLIQLLYLGTHSYCSMWWCEVHCGLFTAAGWSRFLLMRLKPLLSCLCFPVTWGSWAEATAGASVLGSECVTYVWHTYQVFKLLP